MVVLHTCRCGCCGVVGLVLVKQEQCYVEPCNMLETRDLPGASRRHWPFVCRSTASQVVEMVCLDDRLLGSRVAERSVQR